MYDDQELQYNQALKTVLDGPESDPTITSMEGPGPFKLYWKEGWIFETHGKRFKIKVKTGTSEFSPKTIKWEEIKHART